MKIGIISDSHFSYDKAPRLAKSKDNALIKIIDEVDCLIMCGGNAEHTKNITNHRKLFETIRTKSNMPVVFVEGNHALFGSELAENVTYHEIKSRLKQYSTLASEHNIVHLEDQNLVLDDITICGTYGHYDGTLSGEIL